MKHMEPTTEDEMVALFLRTEIRSARFRETILSLLARDGRNRSIVEEADGTDIEANAYRARLLGDFRGYQQERELFDSFPEAVAWYRARIDKEELARVRYIDYSYWNALSGGTRSPAVATRNIRAGVMAFEVSNEEFWSAAQAVWAGVTFPELILVGTSPEALIVMEGHVRLTAYSLAWDAVAEELPILMGISPGFASWG